MARDVKWAVNEAENQGAITKINVDDQVKDTILSESRKSAVGMFGASIAILVIALAIILALYNFAGLIITGAKMVVVYLFIFIFPIYAIYNIIHTFAEIRKGNYDFYKGTVVTKTDKGYKIMGLEDHDINFVKSSKTTGDLKQGDPVNIVRVADDLSLFDV